MPKSRLFTSTTLPFMLRGAIIPHDEDEEVGGGAQTEPAPAGEETQAGGAGEDDLGGETEAGESTEAGGGEDTVAAGAGDDDLGGEPAKRVPWQVKRINKLTAENADALAEAQRLRDENAALRALGAEPAAAPAGGAAPAAKPAAGTFTEEEVNRRAESIAATKVLNDKVDGLYDKVVALDPSFTQRIPQLREAVGQQLLSRPDFFEVVTDLPNGAAVMNALTKDLDRFTEMLDMSPARLGAELARLDVKLAPKGATVSAAGARTPVIKPVVGEGSGEMALDDPKLSMKDYAAQRAAQREARHNAGN